MRGLTLIHSSIQALFCRCLWRNSLLQSRRLCSVVLSSRRDLRPAAPSSVGRTAPSTVSSVRHMRTKVSSLSMSLSFPPSLYGPPARSHSLRIPRRDLHISSPRRHGPIARPAQGTGIEIHFQDHKGNLVKTVEANEGDDILSIAHAYDVDLEGACEGSIACSTCHVILPEEVYGKLPELSDDENDMLDMAFGLTDTSRLGCQVRLTKDMHGMVVQLPSATRNMQETDPSMKGPLLPNIEKEAGEETDRSGVIAFEGISAQPGRYPRPIGDYPASRREAV